MGFNVLRCRADIIIITDKQGANKQGAYSFMRFSQRLGHLVTITLHLSSAYHVRGPLRASLDMTKATVLIAPGLSNKVHGSNSECGRTPCVQRCGLCLILCRFLNVAMGAGEGFARMNVFCLSVCLDDAVAVVQFVSGFF